MDETRIDAAPTPAHLFAYRAFRSVFVPSPESSPVRPCFSPHPTAQDQENAPIDIQHSPRRPSRFTTSPVKAKRKDEDEHVFDAAAGRVRLTPKRQKTVPVSPTKSILRNKNTPKRAGLRDVTVTFKDVRKGMSVSPEMVRLGGSPVKASRKHQGEANAITAAGGGSEKAVSDLAMNVNVDMEAYKAQTEKEMRRLMKYAAKWKETAKKKEEENEQLRGLLEEARRENERLTRRLERIEQERLDAKVEVAQQRKPTSDHDRPRRRSVLEAKVNEQVVEQPKREAAMVRERSSRQHLSEQRRDEKGKMQQARQREAKENASLQRPPERNSSTSGRTEQANAEKALAREIVEVHDDVKQAMQAPPAASRSTVTAPSRITSLPLRLGGRREPMTEERKANALKRLEQRRAARTTSSQAAFCRDEVKERSASKAETDESQVDWLAAA